MLYFPSLIFYTVPIGLNMASSFLIIAKKNTLASIFTILAGIDIELLSVLHSNLAGFRYFQAPFSDSAKSIKFWVAFTNIFLKIFLNLSLRMKSITFDIIPIVTLISSAITLTINIIIETFIFY
ncbi:hypothetical protein C1646_688161, partial [Rhizophagus diaphanus]